MEKITKGTISLEFNNNWEIRDNKGTTTDKNGKEIEVKTLLGSYGSLLPALKRFMDLTHSAKDLNSYCNELESLITEAKGLRVEIVKEVPVIDLKLVLQDKGLNPEQMKEVEKLILSFAGVEHLGTVEILF